MPRVKPKSALSAAYWKTPVTISKKDQRKYVDEVLSMADLDERRPEHKAKAQALFAQLLRILRWYPGMAERQDRERPAHLLRELEPLERHARKFPEQGDVLRARLKTVSDGALCLLYKYRVVDARGNLLSGYIKTLGKTVDALRWSESRQAPKKTALRGLLYRLTLIFRHYHKSETPAEDLQGLITFFRVVLDAAQIKCSRPLLHQAAHELLRAH